MHEVTDEQIDFILADIEKRGVVTEDVKYNILDHVCCIIENELPKGEDFYEFYRNTIARFYRKELKEIEQETQDLLTYKNYYAMKRTLKISGLTSALIILIGAILKVFHLPGAGIAFVLGLTLFSLVFIPLNVVLKMRDNDKKNRWIISLGMIATALASVGILFKIMHWPGAMILFDTGFLVFVGAFIPVYFFSSFKDPEKRFNGMIHAVFMIAGCGMLFALLNQRPSVHIQRSVDSMDQFQHHNVGQFESNNSALYADTEIATDKKAKEVQVITHQLLTTIQGIRANLISKSNEISFEQALTLNVSDVKNPNDNDVVIKFFNEAKDEYSYQALKEAVNSYNQSIHDLNEENVMRPIDLEILLMENTIISVILHELVDVELQVLSNENSFLSYTKGLLVQQ